MFAKLFILFAILPIIEIAVLVNVGDHIGGWNTVGLVILTAFIGAFLVRQQGVSTLMQAQSKMQTGVLPGQEMAEGLLLVIAGVLLVTPGFITDGLGFLFCLPFTRPIIAKSLLKRLSVHVVNSHSQFSNGHSQYSNTHQQGGFRQQSDDDIIEGEYVDKDESKKRPRIDRDDSL